MPCEPFAPVGPSQRELEEQAAAEQRAQEEDEERQRRLREEYEAAIPEEIKERVQVRQALNGHRSVCVLCCSWEDVVGEGGNAPSPRQNRFSSTAPDLETALPLPLSRLQWRRKSRC